MVLMGESTCWGQATTVAYFCLDINVHVQNVYVHNFFNKNL